MAGFDPLSVIRSACARIGADPPATFDAAEADAAIGAVYWSVVDFCLDLHPWAFCRETRPLGRLADCAPVPGWSHAHALPPDAIGEPLAVLTDPKCAAPCTRWALHGGTILSDEHRLWATVAVRTPPERWPGAFREAVILALAGELALSLASNDGLRDELRKAAFGTPSEAFRGGAIGVAIRNQAWRTPAGRLPTGCNPLTAAWRGGGA